MTFDDVVGYIEDERKDIDVRETQAWAIANDRNQVEYNKIRAQLVIQWCIKRREDLLQLTNSLGQLQQQYEAQTRATGPRLAGV